MKQIALHSVNTDEERSDKKDILCGGLVWPSFCDILEPCWDVSIKMGRPKQTLELFFLNYPSQ